MKKLLVLILMLLTFTFSSCVSTDVTVNGVPVDYITQDKGRDAIGWITVITISGILYVAVPICVIEGIKNTEQSRE